VKAMAASTGRSNTNSSQTKEAIVPNKLTSSCEEKDETSKKNLKKKHDGSRCGLKKKNDVFRCVITENPTYSQEIPSKKNDDWELKHAVVKIMALVVFHAKVSSFSNIYLPSDKPVDSVDSYGSHSPFIIH
jgi:hypothetical protein